MKPVFWKHQAVRSRIAAKGGAYSMAVTATVLAILVAVNVFASVLPATVTKYDITSTNLYSVTSSTKVVLNALDTDVTIYWIVQADKEDEIIENLLEKYVGLSSHISLVKKNPDTYPTFAAQYTDETVTNNSLIVECGERSRFISYSDLYLTDVDYTTYSYVYSFDGEGAITSAIDYVISEELPKLYVLEGHGEAELPAEFQTQIEKENIELASFSLLNTEEIPTDADALLIYAPESDISTEEASILQDYLSNGGKLLLFAGPTKTGALTNLYGVAEQYGISAAEGIVVESDRSYYAFQQPYLLLPEIVSHGITDPLLEGRYYAIVPLAQGLTVTGSAATALLTTSQTAYSKVAGFDLATYEKEDDDIEGPFAVAVSADTGNDGQLIWFASGYFLDEVYNAYSSGANLDLAMNALSALIGERDAVSIRSKSLGYNYLTISESAASLLKTWMIGVIPAAFVLCGVFTVMDRRKKRHA